MFLFSKRCILKFNFLPAQVHSKYSLSTSRPLPSVAQTMKFSPSFILKSKLNLWCGTLTCTVPTKTSPHSNWTCSSTDLANALTPFPPQKPQKSWKGTHKKAIQVNVSGCGTILLCLTFRSNTLDIGRCDIFSKDGFQCILHSILDSHICIPQGFKVRIGIIDRFRIE